MISPTVAYAFTAATMAGIVLTPVAAARRTSERRNMPLFMAFREDFPDIWRKWIAPFHADAGLLTPYDVTREALGRLDIWSRYPDEAAFVRRFLEIIHVAEGQGYGSLSSFLDYWNKHGQQEKAPMPDPRQALLDALRGVDRDTLLAVLAEVLTGGGKV